VQHPISCGEPLLRSGLPKRLDPNSLHGNFKPRSQERGFFSRRLDSLRSGGRTDAVMRERRGPSPRPSSRQGAAGLVDLFLRTLDAQALFVEAAVAVGTPAEPALLDQHHVVLVTFDAACGAGEFSSHHLTSSVRERVARSARCLLQVSIPGRNLSPLSLTVSGPLCYRSPTKAVGCKHGSRRF
jgi:hypothetical protein